jgi:DNA-binding transcriptional LysR family regulator
MNELRAISVFVQVADHQSFRHAAVDLALTPQAVSKTIAQLERHLGVRLFHRTTRQTSLTVEGLSLLESVRPGLSAVAQALGSARASTQSIVGPIRVAAAGSARKVLVPLMARFNHLHPQVQFDLLLEDGFTDVVAQQVDLGFRSGSQPTGNVVARRLFGVQQIICASKDYIAQFGCPKNLSELNAHRCTGFRHSETGRQIPWTIHDKGRLQSLQVSASFCTNDPEAEADMVMAGAGLGLIDGINAAAPLRDRALVCVLPQHVSDNLGFYIYYAQRNNMPRRVRAFIDFATQQLLGSELFRLSPAELVAYASGPVRRKTSKRAPNK